MTPMETLSSTLASPRFTRVLFWIGAAVLAVGMAVLIYKLAGGGGSDKTSIAPAKGFKPTLPAKQTTLTNARGERVTSYARLDPQIRGTIRTFLATAVRRHNLGASWNVIAPSLKKGYTKNQWAHAGSLPVIPYPIANLDKVSHTLVQATTKQILVLVGVAAPAKLNLRATVFQIGLVPVKGQWLVNYWMPRETPGVNLY